MAYRNDFKSVSEMQNVCMQNLFRINPMEIHKTRVALTIFDGRILRQENR